MPKMEESNRQSNLYNSTNFVMFHRQGE